MTPSRARLRLVSPTEVPDSPGHPEWEEFALVAGILAVGLIPVVGHLTGGEWDGAAGLGTAVAILAARQLALEARACVRPRR